MLAAFDRQRRYRLIEFAPARALYVLRRYPFIEYRSAGFERNDVDDRIDLTDCAYADGSVDIFPCAHTLLEHIPGDRKAMRELNRILTPDGFGIVLVPLAARRRNVRRPSIVTMRELEIFRGQRLRAPVRQADFIDRLTAAGSGRPARGRLFRRGDVPVAGIADNSVLYVVRRTAAAGTSLLSWRRQPPPAWTMRPARVTASEPQGREPGIGLNHVARARP